MAKKDKMAKCKECANLDRKRSNANWTVCSKMPINVMLGAPATECENFFQFAQCPNAEHIGEHACTNKNQCWEPCGELGKSEDHVGVIEGDEK